MASTLDNLLVKTPRVCGGRIRIDGTRITVQRVVVLYKQGQSAEEIAQIYPQLPLGQIYTVLAEPAGVVGTPVGLRPPSVPTTPASS